MSEFTVAVTTTTTTRGRNDLDIQYRRTHIRGDHTPLFAASITKSCIESSGALTDLRGTSCGEGAGGPVACALVAPFDWVRYVRTRPEADPLLAELVPSTPAPAAQGGTASGWAVELRAVAPESRRAALVDDQGRAFVQRLLGLAL